MVCANSLLVSLFDFFCSPTTVLARPSPFIRHALQKSHFFYFFITIFVAFVLACMAEDKKMGER